MKRHNFNYRLAVIAMSLLAVLATGCKKDQVKDLRLGITSENFKKASGSKVSFDPSSPHSVSSWVASEPIKVNNTVFWTAYAEFIDPYNDVWYLTTDPTNPTDQSNDVTADDSRVDPFTRALYPGASFDGNQIAIDGNTMELTRLVIDYTNANATEQKMAFPMIAVSDDMDANTLVFRHLTGGLKLTLANSGTAAVDLATLKIVAWGDNSTTANLGYGGVTARWVQDGPTVPGGHPGDMTGDMNVSYASEMNFDFRTAGVAGASVPAAGNLTFCVPITLNTVRYLTVTGYTSTGDEVFCKTADLGTGVSIARNVMYTVPSISVD